MWYKCLNVVYQLHASCLMQTIVRAVIIFVKIKISLKNLIVFYVKNHICQKTIMMIFYEFGL